MKLTLTLDNGDTMSVHWWGRINDTDVNDTATRPAYHYRVSRAAVDQKYDFEGCDLYGPVGADSNLPRAMSDLASFVSNFRGVDTPDGCEWLAEFAKYHDFELMTIIDEIEHAR